jgi:hypothetical protein
MNARNIYCSTTENLLYQLGGNDLWIPIVNNQIVKSSISMNLDTITLAGKNAVFNSSPLLTRNNFILEGIVDINQDPDHADKVILTGKFVPDNFIGSLYSVKLMIWGSDGFIEFLLYSWDITLVVRSEHPELPDQYCEEKIKFFPETIEFNIHGVPLEFHQNSTISILGLTNIRYVCIYNSPITLST